MIHIPTLKLARLIFLICSLLQAIQGENATKKQKVRVASFQHPPAIFLDDKDKAVRGFFVDMLKEVAAREGWELEFVHGTWAESLDRVRSGQVELLTSAAFSEERARFLDYGKVPAFHVWSLLYAHSGDSIQSLLDLKGRTVAVTRSDINGAHLKTLCSQFGIQVSYLEVTTFPEVMKAVESKRVDAGITPNTFGYSQEAAYRVVRTPVVVNPFPIYFATAKGHHGDLLRALDAYLAEAKGNSTSHASRTVDKWMHPAGATRISPWILRGAILGGAALVLSLLAILAFRRQVKRATQRIQILNEGLQQELRARTLREERILHVAKGVAAPVGDAFFQELVRSLSQATGTDLACLAERKGDSMQVLAAHQDGGGMPGARSGGVSVLMHPLLRHTLPWVVPSGLRSQIATSLATGDGGFDSCVAIPLVDETGCVFGVIAVLNRDPIQDPEEVEGLVQVFAVRAMSELARQRREVEKQELQRQVLHVQKLESLGVLAGGIAHDFNNLLTAMLGHMNVARVKLEQESPVQHHLEAVEKIIFRTADLTRQMLAYSGKGRFAVSVQDLNQLVHEISHLLQVSLSKRITFTMELDLDPLLVEADGAQLQQVVMNLVTNAGDAIGDGQGTIRITTGRMEADAAYLGRTFEGQGLIPGPYVLLQVEDSGCGMPPEVLTRIFDPFFTTKSTGRGLGLSATLGILKAHRGGLQIYTEVGKGSVFKILLPAAPGTLEPPSISPSTAEPLLSGTVLVVDDEPEVLEASILLLKHLGFDVVSACDGLAGLEVLQGTHTPFRLVLLDVTMPHMDGYETLGKLRELHPDLPVILCSGYSEVTASRNLKGVFFLQKPFSLDDLRRKVLESLAP